MPPLPAVYVTPIAYVAPYRTPQQSVADAKVTNLQGVALAEVCERLARQLKRPIAVEPELRERRVLGLGSSFSPAEVLTHLVTALRFSLRETDAGYEMYRSEEQKKRELNEDKNSRGRYDAALREGYQKLSEKLNEAALSPKMSFGTFLRGFSAAQQDSMLRLAQQPMGMLYAESHRNLWQRTLYMRPFSQLSPSDQMTLRTLLEQGGYQFSDLAGPPENLEASSIGVVAASGELRLGIQGQGAKDIWYDPVNAVSATTPVSGQNADPTDYNAVIAQERDTGQLVRGLTAAWRNKTVRFNPLDKNRYLPAILRDIEKQTGLSFFGASYLHTEYPTWPLDSLKEKTDIPLADALLSLCRAYGQRMELRNGVMYVSSLTPGLDRRLEPSPQVIALIRDKNDDKAPTLTLENFTALCALTSAQLLMLPRSMAGSEWVYTLSSRLQDHYLAANFYAALSEEERKQAMQDEGLEIATLPAAVKRTGMTLTETGITAVKNETAKKPLTFSVQVTEKTLESGDKVLQKVVFTFISRNGFSRKTEFTF